MKINGKNRIDKNITVSIIIPFYKGNQFVQGLLKNIYEVSCAVSKNISVDWEVVIVNDSPEVDIIYTDEFGLNVKIVKNIANSGIHASRVHGLSKAMGEWIVFLDQDDLLIPEVYFTMFEYIDRADVIVGNGYYDRNGIKEQTYKNRKCMEYLIQENRFIGIRNLIPSPGQCLLKRDAIPNEWKTHIMSINGADDWYLWLLLFNQKAKYVFNESFVYIHRSTESGNLSFNYDKMYDSCIEMQKYLKQGAYPAKKMKVLNKAIEFKYLYDVKKIRLIDYFKFWDRFLGNIVYKIKLMIYSH